MEKYYIVNSKERVETMKKYVLSGGLDIVYFRTTCCAVLFISLRMFTSGMSLLSLSSRSRKSSTNFSLTNLNYIKKYMGRHNWLSLSLRCMSIKWNNTKMGRTRVQLCQAEAYMRIQLCTFSKTVFMSHLSERARSGCDLNGNNIRQTSDTIMRCWIKFIWFLRLTRLGVMNAMTLTKTTQNFNNIVERRNLGNLSRNSRTLWTEIISSCLEICDLSANGIFHNLLIFQNLSPIIVEAFNPISQEILMRWACKTFNSTRCWWCW